MKATFGRITRAYTDLSGAFRSISLLCDKMLIYEHEADEEITKTHCHFVAEHNCTTKTLKNTILKNLKTGDSLNGNEDWSMPENNWDKSHKTITYMTKGRLEPKYNQGYTQDEIEKAKNDWTAPQLKQKQQSKLEKLYWDTLDDKKNRLKLLDIKEEVGRKPKTEDDHWQFYEVKKFWWNILETERGIFKNPGFFKDRKTLVLTYCYSEGIEMPPAKDAWENE